MPFNFEQHPGHLFVVATLLPLVSFLLILLAGAIWAALRPYQKNASVRPLFDLFGGEDEDRPGRGRWSAYTATAAIALSFLLCLSGAVKFLTEQHKDEHEKQHAESEIIAARAKLRTARIEFFDGGITQAEAKIEEVKEKVEKLKGEVEEHEATVAKLESKWDGHFDWLRIAPAAASDPASAR